MHTGWVASMPGTRKKAPTISSTEKLESEIKKVLGGRAALPFRLLEQKLVRLVRLLLKENRRLTSNNERLQRQRDQAVARALGITEDRLDHLIKSAPHQSYPR